MRPSRFLQLIAAASTALCILSIILYLTKALSGLSHKFVTLELRESSRGLSITKGIVLPNTTPFTIDKPRGFDAVQFHEFMGKTTNQTDPMLASYSYQGPSAAPNHSQLVRIEVIVRDSPEAGGPQIKNVVFNGQNIPLQPRDIFGNRGTGSFQVPPGKYKLRWQVQKDQRVWPRSQVHEEEINIDPRDLWLQIEIVGDNVSIR